MSTIVFIRFYSDFTKEESSETVETSMTGILGTTLYHLSYERETSEQQCFLWVDT